MSDRLRRLVDYAAITVGAALIGSQTNTTMGVAIWVITMALK